MGQRNKVTHLYDVKAADALLQRATEKDKDGALDFADLNTLHVFLWSLTPGMQQALEELTANVVGSLKPAAGTNAKQPPKKQAAASSNAASKTGAEDADASDIMKLFL